MMSREHLFAQLQPILLLAVYLKTSCLEYKGKQSQRKLFCGCLLKLLFFSTTY